MRPFLHVMTINCDHTVSQGGFKIFWNHKYFNYHIQICQRWRYPSALSSTNEQWPGLSPIEKWVTVFLRSPNFARNIFLSSYCEIRGREPPATTAGTVRYRFHHVLVALLSSNFLSTAFRPLKNKYHKGGSRADHFLLYMSWHPSPVAAERGR